MFSSTTKRRHWLGQGNSRKMDTHHQETTTGELYVRQQTAEETTHQDSEDRNTLVTAVQSQPITVEYRDL